LQAREDEARALGIELQGVDVQSPADFAAGFEALPPAAPMPSISPARA